MHLDTFSSLRSENVPVHDVPKTYLCMIVFAKRLRKELNELNKYAYTFDLNEDQRDELLELIKNNELAKNRLIQIVENNLESNYDFDSLINYLKKKEKKNLINI